eukprot:TRINITY_DN40_c0_g1_i1.p1 TRINITY_DN40_c0_g1~~TRINITY_DN40_c0_g1_i1.p1  ORF type:complete len:544 (+),score=74.93 TRINITY_DN40_c0_g1_i1:255-1886(+)
MTSLQNTPVMNNGFPLTPKSSVNNTNVETPNNKAVLTIGNYRLGKTLGIGSFGKVKVAEHIYTGAKVAIKILNRRKIKNLRMDEKIRREIQNMKLFRHPHIIKLYEVIETPTDIFMVMEYVPGGELFEYIVQHGRLSADEARRYLQQIIAGVEYCHAHMVVHRDLKPENLLLDRVNKSVKIADFGLSNMMQDGDFLKTSCGSPNYAAPEVISGRLYAGPEVDVWSCGVILYALLCARLPFDDEYIPSLFKKIRDGHFVIPDHISPSCADLIKQMLVVDPLKRITISEIRKHPWFQIGLPKYLSYPPQMVTARQIQSPDDEILMELLKSYGDSTLTKAMLTEEIMKGDKGEGNEFLVAYHLLYDSKRLPYYAGGEGNDYNPVSNSIPTESQNLREGEIQLEIDDKPPNSLYPDLNNQMLIDTSISSGGLGSAGSGSLTGALLNSDLFTGGRHKKWLLGVLSMMSPHDIMHEVFRALKHVGFEWKVTGPYQLRCRSLLDGKHPIKVTLQLFKVSEHRYLLDIKKIEGEIMPFFDICSKLLAELNL